MNISFDFIKPGSVIIRPISEFRIKINSLHYNVLFILFGECKSHYCSTTRRSYLPFNISPLGCFHFNRIVIRSSLLIGMFIRQPSFFGQISDILPRLWHKRHVTIVTHPHCWLVGCHKSDNLFIFIDIGHRTHLVLTGLGEEVCHHEWFSNKWSCTTLPFPCCAYKGIYIIYRSFFCCIYRKHHSGKQHSC